MDQPQPADLRTALDRLQELPRRITALQQMGRNFRQILGTRLTLITERVHAIQVYIAGQGNVRQELVDLQRQIIAGAPTGQQLQAINNVIAQINPDALQQELTALEAEVTALEQEVGNLGPPPGAPGGGPGGAPGGGPGGAPVMSGGWLNSPKGRHDRELEEMLVAEKVEHAKKGKEEKNIMKKIKNETNKTKILNHKKTLKKIKNQIIKIKKNITRLNARQHNGYKPSRKSSKKSKKPKKKTRKKLK